MIIYILLAVFAIVAMCWGAYTLFFSVKDVNKENTTNLLSQENVSADNATLDASTNQPLEADSTSSADKSSISMNNSAKPTFENIQLTGDEIPTTSKDTSLNNFTKNLDSDNGTDGEDAFSILANASQTITPTVQTFDEKQLKKEKFGEDSPILDSHIQTQIDNDNNDALNKAVQNLNISLFPNGVNTRIFGGDLLKLFDKYGLKYGVMNMFHRYENKDGTGVLWFSVMMVTEEGIMPFDLVKLPNQYIKGLVMFVALPHPEAGRGFDSMMSISGLLAQELTASLYDELGNVLNKERIQNMRETVINFKV